MDNYDSVYLVQKGDNLNTISEIFRTNIILIKVINNLNEQSGFDVNLGTVLKLTDRANRTKYPDID